jgi:putative ABC transport system permease protein
VRGTLDLLILETWPEVERKMMSALARIWNLFRRTRIDDELRQEIETHLALIEQDERAQGSSAEQARIDARTRFGSPSGYREEARDAAMATWLEHAGKEAVFAARRLVRSPVFTIATVLTLALAIGANAAIFAVVERVVLNPLPYPDSDHTIELDHGSQPLNLPAGSRLTPGLYYQYSERSRTLESVAIYQADDATLTGDGEPERIRVTRATPSLVSVMRMPPVLGRWFSDVEGVPGAPQVGVLSHGLWLRRFNHDSAVLGRVVLLGGIPVRIIGVMPPSFAFPDSRVDLWIALQISRAMGFGLWSYQGVARLRDGSTIADVRNELTGLIADVPRAFPGDIGALGNVETDLIVSARTLKEAMVGGVARGLWMLLAAAGLVLLIACANVTNLFLVRSEVRQREVAIRGALGAGRLGVARFFLAESVLLSMTGGVLGVALAAGAVRVLVRFGPANLPRLDEIRLDGVAVAYAAAVSTLAALIFGAMPLWRNGSIALTLQESGRTSTASRGRHRARQLLMGAQVALALVLLIASGLLVRSFQKLRALDPGFDARSALTFSIGLPDRNYPGREAAIAAHHAILDGLTALPGVRTASASTCLPLAGGCFGNTVRVRGRVLSPDAIPPIALFRAVAGGYFETIGMRILRGRAIERQDVERHAPVVAVDQVFVDQFFPNQNPIGEHIASNLPPRRPGEPPELVWLEIVGVVSNTPIFTLVDPHPLPQLYMPMSIASAGVSLLGPNVAVMSYVVRSTTPATGLLPAVRAVVDRVDRTLPLAQARSLQEILDRSSAQMAFTAVLLAIAAIEAVLLGVVGIYGVMSYLVTQRTGEIGVRLALGAEPHSVAGMIVRQGGLVALVGIAVGLAVALIGSRLIDSLLYGVNARDPAIFAATAVTLFGVALMACWLPARRAARLNPLDALRS